MDDDQTRAFKISVVMPAYNEEAVIEDTVTNLVGALDKADLVYELRVVDDNSKDSTWQKLAGLVAKYPSLQPVKNSGPGGFGTAVRAGLATFEGDAAIIVMADGSDSPRDVVSYSRALAEGYDCAFGTRFSGATKISNYPPVKRIFNRMGNKLIAWLTGCRYDDFTNGFKGYRRKVLNSIQPLVSADFNLTVELSIKAVLSGARFVVIPNEWRDREGGESKFRVMKLAPIYLLTIAYCLLQNQPKADWTRLRSLLLRWIGKTAH